MNGPVARLIVLINNISPKRDPSTRVYRRAAGRLGSSARGELQPSEKEFENKKQQQELTDQLGRYKNQKNVK